MEFRFRAGDRGASSFASGSSSSTRFPYPVDGYFGAQGMREGYLPPPPPPPLDWEAAERECFIREEVERRLIEAEVRRELEASRGLAFAGGYGPGRFMPPPPMPMHLPPHAPPPMPFGELGAWQQAPDQFRPRVQPEFGQRMLLPDEKRRWPPLPPKPKHKLQLREIHPCESSKVLSSDKKVLGLKRKLDSFSAPTEPRVCSKQSTAEPKKAQRLAKNWSCALCQVSATCEARLNEHLQGKKHKIKLVQCGAIKVVTDDKSSFPATTTGNKNGTDSSDAPKKICIVVDGAMHDVVQKSNYLWCERCKIRCHSNVAMADHLRGKKHSELNKVLRSIKAVRVNTKNTEGLSSYYESKANENGATEIPGIVKDDVDVAIEVDENPIENLEEIKKEGMFMVTEVLGKSPVETPVEIKKEGTDMSNHNDVTQPSPKE